MRVQKIKTRPRPMASPGTDYPLPILEALDMLGYHPSTAIQQEVIPLVLAGKNVVARSRTGTGKTAAFAVPSAKWPYGEEKILPARLCWSRAVSWRCR